MVLTNTVLQSLQWIHKQLIKSFWRTKRHLEEPPCSPLQHWPLQLPEAVLLQESLSSLILAAQYHLRTIFLGIKHALYHAKSFLRSGSNMLSALQVFVWCRILRASLEVSKPPSFSSSLSMSTSPRIGTRATNAATTPATKVALRADTPRLRAVPMMTPANAPWKALPPSISSATVAPPQSLGISPMCQAYSV